MCIMDLQILFELLKSKVRVCFAKILKVGHGFIQDKGMATKRLYEHKDNWCNECWTQTGG